MNHHPKILPECYGDTVLVELLGFSKPNHQPSGIGQVLKVMETQMSKQTAVGVIDFDKKIFTPYFKEFITVKTENAVTLMRHLGRNHHLILVTPALEKFILKAAMDVNIEVPFSEKRLKNISKTRAAGNNQPFKQFLNRIIQRKSPGTETLKAWLREIIGDEI